MATGLLLAAFFAPAAWSQGVPSMLDSNATQVVAGGSHACALTTAGGVSCWGLNANGQLGDGTTTSTQTPVAVAGLTGGAVIAIAAGGFHTCALLRTGTANTGAVQCWGQNLYGQLGNGSSANSAAPVAVSGLAGGPIAIAASGYNTCALLNTGAVQCWGANSYGQLGNGSSTDSSTPVTVTGLSGGVIAIATGLGHSCALTTAGAMQCWGRNQAGQLGDGSTSNSSVPVSVANLAGPVAQIATGANHTCAVTSAGAVQCWGANNNGQLGNGATTDSPTPVTPNGLSSGMAAVAAGTGHSCAMTNAGAVQCWGANSLRQLGDGTTTASSAPVATAVFATSTPNTSALAIAAGSNHSCALTRGGGVQCWGSNSSGQLGINSTLATAIPPAVVGLSSTVVYASHAVPAGSGAVVAVETLAAGSNHTCALTSAGGVQCWGSNNMGQLGNYPGNSPAPVAIAGLGSNVAEIAAGGNHNCVRTVPAFGATTGGVQCWGSNFYGELGQAAYTGTTSAAPLAVDTLASGVVAVATGYQFSCALTDASYGVRCWGRNDVGQLGIGSASAYVNSPVPVSGLSGVIAIAAGDSHACALLNSGTVKCWGRPNEGQLGNGKFTWVSYAPVDVGGLSNVVAIAAGGNDSCALTSAGAMYCWGDSLRGQLGNGTSGTGAKSAVPVQVSGLGSGVAAIAVGSVHACAVTNSGGAQCWGFNFKGQLGNGSTVDSNVPVAVPGLTGVVAMTAGNAHTCALATSGILRCWGEDANGQLGNGTTTGVSTPVLARAGQTLDFTAPQTLPLGGNFTPSAIASGGGTIAYDVWPVAGNCALSGGKVLVLKPGLCGVRASAAGFNAASGDNFAPAPQALRLIRILRATPTMSLATSGSPSAPGAAVTFTATLPGSASASGIVSVCADAATTDAACSGGTLACSATASGAQAVCTTSMLAPGPHAMTAYFAGDDYNDPAATTSSIAQFVGIAPAITSANTATFALVQPGSFLVTTSGAPAPGLALAPSDALPSGVQFVDNGDGTASLSGIPALGSVGAYTLHITAHSAVAPDAVQTFTLGVQKAAGSITIDPVSPSSSVYGQSVTLSATLSSINARAGGSVAFLYKDGFNTPVAGCTAAPVVSGQAQCTATKLAFGAHSIIASYSGDANTESAASSNSAAYTVAQAATAVTLTPPAAITLGGSVSINAVVAVVAPGAGTLSGTIAIATGGAGAGDSCTITLPATNCALTPSSTGTKTLTAIYTPDAAASTYFSGSSAVPATLMVNPAAVSAALGSSVNPSVFGQPVALTATLTPTNGTATPTTGSGVHFLIDGVEVCAGSTLSPTGSANAASASCAVPQAGLGVGNHTVQFQYLGDAGNQAASATLAGGQSVNAADTNVAVDSLAAITLGQTTSVSVHVAAKAPGSGTPAGTVTVGDGTASCNATLANGDGNCTLTPVSAGTKIVTATYTPDAADNRFNGGSASTSLAVGAAPSTATLASSANPSVFGQSVTFTATISSAAGVPLPMGTVTFFDGGIARCGPIPVQPGAGSASGSCAAPALASGHHAITANYSGDANHQAATTAPVDQTVNAAATTLTLTPPATIALGNSVSVEATLAVVAPGAGTPSGTITIGDAGAGSGDHCTIALPATRCSLTPGGAGVKTLTATYAPDAAASGNFAGSSASGSLTVTAAISGTALASSANPSVFGQSVTFTATVTPANGGVLPTGTVTFRDGATDICTDVALTAAAGGASATCATSSLAVGMHTITAAYSGDANNQASNATLAGGQVVDTVPSSTALSAAPSSTVFGQAAVLTATVTSANPAAAGAVAFSADGAALPGCEAVALNAGKAACTTAALAVGTHAIAATYSGDADTAASSAPARSYVVAKAATTTTLAAPAPITLGAAVDVAATVAVAAPGAGAPTGTIAVDDGAGAHCTIALPATHCALTPSGAGTKTLTATYTPDAAAETRFTGSSASASLVVNASASAPTLMSSANPSVFGQSVTFTAMIAGSGTTPTGSVTFSDGAAVLCSAVALAATASGAGAACTTATLAVGDHAVRAAYSGDANHQAAHVALTQTVDVAATTLGLAAPASIALGQSATVTAQLAVTAPGAGAPDGSVVVSDGSASCTIALPAGSCSLRPVSAGAKTLTASYAGDGRFRASSATASMSVVASTSSVALTSAPNPSTLGQMVTITATVSAAAAGSGTAPGAASNVTHADGASVPTGSVTFRDGTTLLATVALDANGQATYATSALAAGTHAISASYSGDAGNAAAAAADVQQVDPIAAPAAVPAPGLSPPMRVLLALVLACAAICRSRRTRR